MRDTAHRARASENAVRRKVKSEFVCWFCRYVFTIFVNERCTTTNR
jgi:hypothetical protein